MTHAIRPEIDTDIPTIRQIHLAAFDGPDEADLVDALGDGGHVLASLVAEIDGQVVGHILFSRMHIETDDGDIPAASLAPMAVLPDHQNRGIGSELVERGLEHCRDLGERIAVVLGHPDYYPRFGFRPELAADLDSPWTGSDAFMALELADGALHDLGGRVRYPAPFGIDEA